MEKVEVTDSDRVLLRALDIPASNDALMSVASHRIEATRANDEEIARGQAAMWLLASILKAKSAFESGDRNTAGVDPDAWEEAARSILGDAS